jgi:hypothetical protein
MNWVVFAGLQFYPRGGWMDYQHRAASLSDAKDWLLVNYAKEGFDWHQIVNVATGDIFHVDIEDIREQG